MGTQRAVAIRRGKERGFSLPELLVVIAIMGIFTVFAGPALAEAFRSYGARTAANNLVTDIKALRYLAVTNRAARSMTLNDQANASPNRYSYPNARGQTVSVVLENVNIETTSAGTITFNINGSTGQSGNQVVRLSRWISDSRNDRYTITITPSGTVSSAYSTF